MKTPLSIFLFCICAHWMGFSEDIFDVETLPSNRTKQYPIAPYKKIVVFSAPRTGSSLTYNIFRYLFEDPSKIFSYHNQFDQDRLVLKTHKFTDLDLLEEKNILYIFTVRNPLNACISNYRICTRKISNNRAFAKELVDRHQKYLTFAETMKKKGKNILWLRYEDFVDQLDVFFDYIEDHFNFTIDSFDKELIKKGYSKKNIHSCIEQFTDFNDYLPTSGFHGKHINANEFTPPKDFVHWLKIYLKDIQPQFRNYGYFLDPA